MPRCVSWIVGDCFEKHRRETFLGNPTKVSRRGVHSGQISNTLCQDDDLFADVDLVRTKHAASDTEIGGRRQCCHPLCLLIIGVQFTEVIARRESHCASQLLHLQPIRTETRYQANNLTRLKAHSDAWPIKFGNRPEKLIPVAGTNG